MYIFRVTNHLGDILIIRIQLESNSEENQTEINRKSTKQSIIFENTKVMKDKEKIKSAPNEDQRYNNKTQHVILYQKY